MMRDPFFMATQPLTPACSAYLLSNHQRPLTQAENEALANPPADVEQIVLVLNVPNIGLEHGIGLAPLGSLRDTKVKFRKKDSRTGKIQESSREFKCDIFFPLIRFMMLLNALAADCVELTTKDSASYERGRADLDEMQSQFSDGELPIHRIFGQENGKFLQPVVLEPVPTSDGQDVDKYRYWFIFRGKNVLDNLLELSRKAFEYMGVRFVEEKTFVHNVGHDSSVAAPVPVQGDNNAQAAKEGNDGEGQQTTFEDFGWVAAQLPDGTPEANAPPAFDEQKQAKAFYLKNGHDWANTPESRRKKLGAIMAEWETSLARLIKPHFAERGLGYNDVKQFFSYVWHGDVFEYCHPSALEGKVYALEPDADKLFPGCSLRESGQYYQKFSIQDFKNLGSYSQISRRLESIQPAYLFAPNLCNWSNGNADATQLFIGNYFRLPGYRDGVVHGRPDQDISALIDTAIDQHPTARRYASMGKMTLDMAQNMLLSPYSRDPIALGRMFRGFPHPDRCYVLSPMTIMPHRISLSILPSPCDTVESNRIYLHNSLRRAIKYVMPTTREHKDIVQIEHVQCVLFGSKREVNDMLRDETVVDALSEDGLLAELIAARHVMRYLMATSAGMIREWGLRMDHAQLSNYGNATFQQGGVNSDIDPDAEDWDLFTAEPDGINEDVPDRRKWGDFMTKIQECMGERDAHLARCLSATRNLVEVCDFTKTVRELTEIIPWRTMDKIVAATNKKQKELMHESIYSTVFTPPTGLMAENDSEHETRAWSHRNVTAANAFDLKERPSRSGLVHTAWKLVGPFSKVEESPIDVLRREKFASDFIGDYHTNLQVFVTNLMKPLEVFIIWASKKDRQAMGSRNEKLRDAAIVAHKTVLQFCHLFKINNSRVFFIRVPYEKLNSEPVFEDSFLLPEAFKAAFYRWTHHLGTIDCITKIKIEEHVDKWTNLDTAHGILMARTSGIAMHIGIGLNGSSSMLPVFHQTRAAFMSSALMSKDKAKLQHYNVILSADTATGKSFLVAGVFLTMVPGTYDIVTSISEHAWEVREAFDGMSVYFDEGNTQLTGGLQNRNQSMVDMLKMIMTTGMCHRTVCSVSDASRIAEFIYASHRRAFCMSMNYSVAFMDIALKGRFAIKNLRSTSSDEKQPLEHSIHARAGQTSATDELRRLAILSDSVAEFQAQHACKIVIESCIQQGLMNVNVESMTDVAIQIFSPHKNKVDHSGAMMRTYSMIPLILRSYITDVAAWILLALFISEHRDGKYANCDFMPFEFIIQNAPRYLYATTGLFVYAATVLFQDKIDNQSHVDIAVSIIKHQGKQLDAEKAVYATTPILQTQAVPDRMHDPDSAKKLDALANAPYVVWSDDEQFRGRISKSTKVALDLNYVIWDCGARSYNALVKHLANIMPVGRSYGEQQIKTAIEELKNRYFIITEETDYNILHAKYYNEAIEAASAQKLESTRTAREFAQRLAELQGEREMDPNVVEMTRRTSKALSNMNGQDPSGGGGGGDRGQMKKPNSQYETMSADPLGYNMDDDKNEHSHLHKEDSIAMMSLREAAVINLPLMRRNYGVKAPMIMVVNTGSKTKQSLCLAVSRHFIEEVKMLQDMDNENVDLPITSTLVGTLKENLNKMAPYPMYPPAVMTEVDKSIDREVIITTYDLSASSSHVAGRVKTAWEIVKENLRQRNVRLNRDIFRVAEELSGKLLREGMVLTAHAPIEIKYRQKTSPIVLVNQSKNSPTTKNWDPVVTLLSCSKLPSFLSQKFIRGPACDPKQLNKREHVLDRYAAIIVDSNRLWYSVKQDNRVLTHGLDWESLRQHCAGMRPLSDPMDPVNYRSLPLICIRRQIQAKMRRQIEKGLAVHSRSSEVYPVSDIQHQLKSRVFNILFKAFPQSSESLQVADPADHGMTIFALWLETALLALNEHLEADTAEYYGYSDLLDQPDDTAAEESEEEPEKVPDRSKRGFSKFVEAMYGDDNASSARPVKKPKHSEDSDNDMDVDTPVFSTARTRSGNPTGLSSMPSFIGALVNSNM